MTKNSTSWSPEQGQLGAFTAYDIEQVYDFIGHERINRKIDELKNTPTMGIKFQDFVHHDPQYSFYSGKGKLWIFTIIMDWFKDYIDLDLIQYLYEQSKKYNENNYFEGKLLNKERDRHLSFMDQRIQRNPDKRSFYESEKQNPYWIEYHFFMQELAKRLDKYKSDYKIQTILANVLNEYYDAFDTITMRMKAKHNFWPDHGIGSTILGMMIEH